MTRWTPSDLAQAIANNPHLRVHREKPPVKYYVVTRLRRGAPSMVHREGCGVLKRAVHAKPWTRNPIAEDKVHHFEPHSCLSPEERIPPPCPWALDLTPERPIRPSATVEPLEGIAPSQPQKRVNGGRKRRSGRVEFTIPVRTVSEANMREHWTAKNRRKKQQQEVTAVSLMAAGIPCGLHGKSPIGLPCHVSLTRYGAKALDTDNLAGSFKHVQDSIADWFEVDDGDTARIRFEYNQVPTGKRDYFVRVEIRELG